MSLHFSANQYDKNFDPKLLQNWEVSSQYRQRPRAFMGFTQVIANDRGHLTKGVKKSRESPWGTFVGTWDMPSRIPGNSMLNATARTDNATLRLERLKTDGDIILSGKLKQCRIPSPLPVKADIDADKTLPPKASNSDSKISNRSGAVNPEPVPSGAAETAPQIRPSSKPMTPNFDWPRPSSQGQRQRSATPKVLSPKPATPKSATPKPGTPKSQLAPIQSPKPPGSRLANDGRIKTPIHWPTPQTADVLTV